MSKLLHFFNRLLDHPDFARLLLRLTIGGLLICHGIFKISHGVGFIQNQLLAHGLPAFIAYGVYIGEVIAPILIILGILTRPSALIIAFTMFTAWMLTATQKTFTLDGVGAWGIESIAFFFFGALVILFLGAGKYALAPSTWR